MAPNVTLHFFPANDLNGSVLHEITDEDSYFRGLELKIERDGLGGADLLLARKVGFAGFGSGTFNSEVFVRVLVHAYSDTVYYPWGFFLNKRQQTVVHVDEDGGEVFRFGGAGPKQYLDRAKLGIGGPGAGWNVDLDNGDWRWGDSATVGKILDRVINQDSTMDDPALPDLTYTFDASDDSASVAWADTDLSGPAQQYRIPIGTSLLKVLYELDDVVELTSWVDLGTVASPKFELNVIQGLGDDNTGSSFGAGVCLLKEGTVSMAEKALDVEGNALRKASHVIVEGSDGAWAVAERPGFSPGDYVKYEKIEYTRSNSVYWLDKAGIRWLKRQDYGEKELAVEIVPGASDATGRYFPAPDRVLWLSNLISVDTSADGTTHTPLDIQPSEEQLVTGFLLTLGEAGDTTDATAKAKSWKVKVQLNRERPGNVARTPDQRSSAVGGGNCKCLKFIDKTYIATDGTWRTMEHASLADGEINPEPADWKEVGYDDSASPWISAEVVGSGFDADTVQIKHPAQDDFKRRHEFFYRREFWIEADDISGANVTFHYYADDGMFLYVNGTLRLTAGTQWNAGPLNVSTTLDSDFFQPGLNCVAVHVWNQEAGTDGTAPNPGGCFFGLEIHQLSSDQPLGEGGGVAHGDHDHTASEIPIVDLGAFYDSDNVEGALQEIAGGGGGGGAPSTADYLVGTAQGGLSAEIVVGTTPGGELGGTWASPTVDATHSGSTHSAATDTHIADGSDAHDASAISVADAGGLLTATDVEAALAEIATTAAGTVAGKAFSAEPLGFSVHTNTGNLDNLAAAGGTVLIPMVVVAPLALNDIFYRNFNTSLARSCEFGLYRNDAGTLNRVASGTDSFTPAAATNRSVTVSGAPVALAPGLYWLACRNTHASNTFAVGYADHSSPWWNGSTFFYSQTLGSALGSTLTTSGWTAGARQYGFRLRSSGGFG